MKRKTFIKALSATAIVSLANPAGLIEVFLPDEEFYLPFIDGKRKVIRLKSKIALISELKAQYYYRQNYSYGAIAPYQQWYAYQQALQYWQQRMLYWRQQQYYAWLRQAHIQKMQQLLYRYRHYQ